jgi:hypothetical protein
MKVILKCLSQVDPYTGEMAPRENEYNGIPEACAMWASGYKHAFLEDCHLYYADSGLEVPDRITDKYYDRYYYGRYIFDQNGEEIGKTDWKVLYLKLFYRSYDPLNPDVSPKMSAILIKERYLDENMD